MAARPPAEMRALVLREHHADAKTALRSLALETRPVPAPGPGQVLVRIAAAPCNPSDVFLLQGLYGASKTLPAAPGWEGAGTVVAVGPGMLPRWLQGRRVACASQSDGDGTWAEYFLAPAAMCIPLSTDVDDEQGAMLIVNPIAAYALFGMARGGKHRAAVNLAAASQVGRMLVRLAGAEGYPMIHVVRRSEQVALLRDLGAEHVLDSSAPGFAGELGELCARLGASLAFDPTAGPGSGAVLAAMPKHSTLVVYGALSEQPCGGFDPADFIFAGKRVEGFWLSDWMVREGLLGRIAVTQRVQQLVARGILSSTVALRLSLEEAPTALAQHSGSATSGKALILPNLSRSDHP
jgi:NADPH:quinone reductase-like Zn-dependent oxidoreductase